MDRNRNQNQNEKGLLQMFREEIIKEAKEEERRIIEIKKKATFEKKGIHECPTCGDCCQTCEEDLEEECKRNIEEVKKELKERRRDFLKEVHKTFEDREGVRLTLQQELVTYEQLEKEFPSEKYKEKIRDFREIKHIASIKKLSILHQSRN